MRIFGLERQERVGEWEQLNNEDHQLVYLYKILLN
jgi:hypothetical protein